MDKLEQIILIAPVLLFSMVAHEYAHGYAALKQGDQTASLLGRLTWNPIKHIDPFMTILLPIFLAWVGGPIFGGAKPVPVNPSNYRHLKRGDIIVSLAGIATNLVLAAISVPLVLLVGWLGQTLDSAIKPLAILQLMLVMSVQINLVLAIFNLLPIPPLDGSHVFKYLLPPRMALAYQRLGAIGFLILFALLAYGRPILDMWFRPIALLMRAAQGVYYPYMLPNPFQS